MATTALTLVNDLLDLQRLTRVAAGNFLTEPAAQVALQLVNEGIEKVLNDKTWDFAHRHDGLMTTSPSLTGTVTLTQDSQNFTILSPITPALDFVNTDPSEVVPVRYMVMTGDATYPNTPWRIRQLQGTGGATVPGWFDRPWRGATVGAPGVAYTMASYEYVFPAFVKDVTGVRSSEVPLKLHMLEPSERLDDIIPRPTDTINDNPQIMAVGHSASPQTVAPSLQDEGEVRMRGYLFPVPLSRYPLQYSYTVRYAKLTASSSPLKGVKETAIREVIQYALAQWNLSPAGNDPKLGTRLKQENRFSVDQAMRGESRGTSARSTIEPFSTRGRFRYRDRYVGPIEGL